jgi:hypothetical protein
MKREIRGKDREKLAQEIGGLTDLSVKGTEGPLANALRYRAASAN